MEVISKETNGFHHNPTKLNGKNYSSVTKKLVNCVIERNVRQADEISANNSPSTANVRMQTSTERSSEVLIVGDSHLKAALRR